MIIESLPSASQRDLPQLVALMRDAVDHGASIGFLPPLTDAQAVSFWDQRFKEISSGKRVILVARDGDTIVGSVQLELAGQANAEHRAEVQKLFVHTSHRGRGIAKQLMNQIEAEAAKVHRHLLILDTKTGDAAESLYRALGWEFVGSVPAYSKQADGSLADTSIFYKKV